MVDDAELESKIKAHAQKLWEEHGSPPGRESEFMDKASIAVKAWELGKQTGKNPRGTDYRDKEDL